MQIIISDTNALIDLRKGVLLEALLRLPYEVQIPDFLYADELISFSPAEKRSLHRQGLKVVGLAGPLVDKALRLARTYPALRFYDCTAFVLAESSPGTILLTGDNKLKGVAEQHQVEVHGVLWAVDEMHRHAAASNTVLRAALSLWLEDSTVWLPAHEIQVRLRRLGRGG
jgi:predicted nucleic acid-binding protein